MDSPCIKQTVCKVLKIFQYGKYLVAYVLKKEEEFVKAKALVIWLLIGVAPITQLCTYVIEIVTIKRGQRMW